MFVLFFAIFIFLFTVFENIFIVWVAFLFCLIGILLFFRKDRAKIISHCSLVIASCFLAIATVRVYNAQYNQWLYGQELAPIKSGTWWPSTIFLWTGHITDRQWQGKYLMEDGKLTYILVSQNNYQIGDRIRLAGNIKTTNDTWWNNHCLDCFVPRNDKGQWFVAVIANAVKQSITGLFHYEFNYDKRLKMKWIHWIIYEQNSIPILVPRPATRDPISSLRISLQSMVKNSYGENKTAWLVLGMLIGDKSQIPKSDYQSFINSGLVHLIAVSGGNIIMIVVFLWFILLRLPFYLRNFVILLCIITYGLLCGMDSSVLRAVIMWGLGMIALFRGRQIDIWRSIAIAFVGMLMYNPYYLVYDVGFLFSFSAIIGLIYFNNSQLSKNSELSKTENQTHSVDSVNQVDQVHKKRSKAAQSLLKIRTYVWKNYLSPSVWATLGILPTMIFFMGKINLLGIVGNLFVLPIVPFVMIYGFVGTVLYHFIPRQGFIQIETRLIQYIYRISQKIWEYGLYMNVEWDRIKYLILIVAIIRFVRKRIKKRLTTNN